MKVKSRTVSYNGRDYEVKGARASFSVNRDGELEDLELAYRGDYHLWVTNDHGDRWPSAMPVVDPALIDALDIRLLNQLEDELLRDLPEPDHEEERAERRYRDGGYIDYLNDTMDDR